MVETVPDSIDVLVAFLNTRHVELHREDLAGPGDLDRFASEHGLDREVGRLTAYDVVAARELREALRTRVADGWEAGDDDTSSLVATAAAARFSLAMTPEGVTLNPLGTGWALLSARLLALLLDARSAGTLARLKVCPGEECAWAFHDRSRNSSRTWCSEQVCGARTRSRAYRQRRSGR
ncbi:zf-CGNR multi-domain protein [Nocardioides guangzhouensis]|uniref:Zf-CGNR multi-domain protein n=1 Tax=Nocardioides guangzhouensis TaxID=2497878 RepID=A0A4Q4ZL25_9ACTN|nr:CGNR zinc finger domain-containing protein [Nocardioides guangzhouensis]RYP88635.1 zf-CGNR multi-domain protein [Nocardioides guangzhouensis]